MPACRIRASLFLMMLVASAAAPAVADPPRYVVTDLGDLGNRSATSFGLNNRGQVVGESAGQPFLWSPDRPNGTTGSMTNLALQPNASYGQATGINDSGQVVGRG